VLARSIAGLGPFVGTTYPPIPPLGDPGPPPEDVADEEEELANLAGRTDIGDTERTQLTRARRGQGVFRANVRMNESRCRVTGTSDPAHLYASHIKPWKDSDDVEKIHGCNGLLLAPHIDHLFDRGWISFADNGDLLISTELDPGVLATWHITPGVNTGGFSEAQAGFLQHHRAHVFRDRPV
jgi:putative restriction endonuclease